MNIKRSFKKIALTIAAIFLLLGCVIGGFFLKDYLNDKLNPQFEKTAIFPDDSRDSPKDTIFNVNGIEIKMIGIKGGKINCKGLRDTIELDDFYIGETEITQELWMSIMNDNPSVHRDSIHCPVENVDLVECLEFVNKLNSVSGHDFDIQSSPQWLYAAYLGNEDANFLYCGSNTLDSVGWYKENSNKTSHPVKQKKPNTLGIYDMTGNVAEWTISGSDPFFIVMGGSYDSEEEYCRIDKREYDHANIKMGTIGLRLVCYPERPNKN